MWRMDYRDGRIEGKWTREIAVEMETDSQIVLIYIDAEQKT